MRTLFVLGLIAIASVSFAENKKNWGDYVANDTGEEITYEYRMCDRDGACTDWQVHDLKDKEVHYIRGQFMRSAKDVKVQLRYHDKNYRGAGKVVLEEADAVEGTIVFEKVGSRLRTK